MVLVALERAGTYITSQLGDWKPSKPVTVAVHGFGMIGKAFFIAQQLTPQMRDKIVVGFINDKDPLWRSHINIVNSPSIYGETGINASLDTSNSVPKMLLGGGGMIDLLSERDPSKLPLTHVDVVIDTSGDRPGKDRKYFESFVQAGAGKVLLPNFHVAMDKNIIMGFNEDLFSPSQDNIVGCGSCSLNLQVPLLGLLSKRFKLRSLTLSVLHATNVDQSATDVPHPGAGGALGRSAGNNFMVVPSRSLGDICHFFPELKKMIHAFSVRIPVSTGMAIHSIIRTGEITSVDEVNEILAEAANGSHKGLIRTVTEYDGFSSSQTQANPESAIVDLSQTAVVNGDQISILAWQDPFLGYSVRILDVILWMAYRENADKMDLNT